jgi:NAD-dependent DNA ligase
MDLNILKASNELYFLDIETINHLDIVQIGITRWKKNSGKLEVIFDEIINPRPLQSKINQYAANIHFVGEYRWSKAFAITHYYRRIQSLLSEQKVIHWGGNDVKTLNLAFSNQNLPEINCSSVDLLKGLVKKESLQAAANSLGFKSTAFHDASFDSFMAGIIFLNNHLNLKPSKTELDILKVYNEKFLPLNKAFSSKDIIRGNGSKGSICLTGLRAFEKLISSNHLEQLGYSIKDTLNKSLDYLIVPSCEYKGSPSKEQRAKSLGIPIIDYDSFLNKLMKLKTPNISL